MAQDKSGDIRKLDSFGLPDCRNDKVTFLLQT